MRQAILLSLLSISALAVDFSTTESVENQPSIAQLNPSVDFSATQPQAVPAPSETTTQVSNQSVSSPVNTPENITAMSESTSTQSQDPNIAFLESHKSQSGVVTLPDGLQYRVIKEGTGTQPTATDSVTVNYKGMLVNQTVFDSSYDRHEPLTLRLDQVIQGWRDALPLMKEGAVWELVIPSHLAYGDAGVPNVIPPKSVLIFEVQLISVNR